MIRPQFILDLNQELIVDNFAGGGGASTGIEMATGRHVDHAINHDRMALGMHRINHPQTVHHTEDIFDVDPATICENRPVGLAHFSPDCFPAGTLVLTRRGYTPIEEIAIGDEVFTHMLRWKRVTETSNTRRQLLSIKGHGHPGLIVSPEHPFYAKRREDVWSNATRSYQRTFSEPTWAPASAMDNGWYWSTPTVFPTSEIPYVDGRGMELDERLLWLAGRYLGDGWTRLTETRAEIVITCGRHEVERLREALSAWPRKGERSEFNELEWHERLTGTAYQFTANHRGLVKWLRQHFGHRAESKRVPAWILGLPEHERTSFANGYLSADGWVGIGLSECRTVSKALAFGMKSLLNTLGKTVIVHRGANSPIIQGRAVNAREIYMLRWRESVAYGHAQAFRENGMEWCPIRSQKDLMIEADVFNIGVEDDESYVVEGIVVHNCKHFSKAKGGKPLDKRIRGLVLVMLRWAKYGSRVMTMENVEEIETWCPLIQMEKNGILGWYPDLRHKGRTWKAFLACISTGIDPDHPDLPEILEVLAGTVTKEECVRGFGYSYETKQIRACDHGTPTIRKRLFGVFRRDGRAITWPKQTHFDPSRYGDERKEMVTA